MQLHEDADAGCVRLIPRCDGAMSGGPAPMISIPASSIAESSEMAGGINIRLRSITDPKAAPLVKKSKFIDRECRSRFRVWACPGQEETAFV